MSDRAEAPTSRIAFGGTDRQYRRLQSELDAAALRVLASGWYVGGPEVKAFEEAFAAWSGARHAVAVANGTDAIALALRAAGLPSGAHVIVPAVSAYPTAVGVVMADGVPRFVDVGEDGVIDVAAAAAAIDVSVRAIVPVHLYGRPCDMTAVAALARRHDLILVEDCAQAHGARWDGRPVGGFGHAASWSFYPTKNLGAAGDAGAVTSDTPSLAERVSRLRNYGQSNRYEHVEVGFNSRLDPIQAALLAVKLRHLDEENARRESIARRYVEGLAQHPSLTTLPPLPAGARSSHHLFPVFVRVPSTRDALQAHLAVRGVETLIHYPIPMPHQRASQPSWSATPTFPRAERLCASVLSLPLHPDLTDEEADRVVAAVREWRAP